VLGTVIDFTKPIISSAYVQYAVIKGNYSVRSGVIDFKPVTCTQSKYTKSDLNWSNNPYTVNFQAAKPFETESFQKDDWSEYYKIATSTSSGKQYLCSDKDKTNVDNEYVKYIKQ